MTRSLTLHDLAPSPRTMRAYGTAFLAVGVPAFTTWAVLAPHPAPVVGAAWCLVWGLLYLGAGLAYDAPAETSSPTRTASPRDEAWTEVQDFHGRARTRLVEDYPGQRSIPTACPVCSGPVDVESVYVSTNAEVRAVPMSWSCPEGCDPRATT